MAKPKIIHSIFNPEDSLDVSNSDSPLLAKYLSYINSNNFTPEHLVELLTGKYGHEKDDIANIIDEIGKVPEETASGRAPHLMREHADGARRFNRLLKDPELSDQIINELKNNIEKVKNRTKTDEMKGARGVNTKLVGELSKHVINSPKNIDNLIHILKLERKFPGAENFDYSYRGSNDLENNIVESPHVTKDHIKQLLDLGKHEALKSPQADKEILDHVLSLPKEKRQKIFDKPGTISHLAANPNLQESHVDTILNDYFKNLHEKGSRDPSLHREVASLLERIPQEKAYAFYDKVLGIKDGELLEDHRLSGASQKAFDRNFNWNNFQHGPGYSEKVTHALAEGAKLPDKYFDFIKRHGTKEQKWALYQNPHLPLEHAKEMKELYEDDESDLGYDHDWVKDKIKEDDGDGPNDSDYEEGREKAEEDYPFSEYLRDQFSSDDDKAEAMDYRSYDDYVEKKLQEVSDWTHFEGAGKGDSGHPIYHIMDYEDDPEKHPEYKKRVKDVEGKFEKDFDDWREEDRNEDSLYDGYSEATSENASEEAWNLYQARLDEWYNHGDYLPQALQTERDTSAGKVGTGDTPEAREGRYKARVAKQSQDDKKAKDLVDEHLPNRFDTLEYGPGQHYMEMAKEHADQNKGIIHLGQLIKNYPQLKDQWKKLFGNKQTMSSSEIQQKVDDLPKTKYKISYGKWTSNLQNTNDRDQVVVRLDHSDDSKKVFTENPEVQELFDKIQDASYSSGHPVGPDTIGWSRVDFNEKGHPFIDEAQSDFSSQLRHAYEKHDKKDEADRVKNIMDVHKEWREPLLHSVIKLAKLNGAKKISTHTGESKAKHTHSDKVHTVYHESYHKYPKRMGFQVVAHTELPLTEHGAKVFLPASKTKEDVESPLNERLKAWRFHASTAAAHKQMLDHGKVTIIQGPMTKDPTQMDLFQSYPETVYETGPEEATDREEVYKFRSALADKHRKAILSTFPEHELKDLPAVPDFSYFAQKDPSKAVAAIQRADYDAELTAEERQHPGDELLNKKPEPVPLEARPAAGHTLDLRPEAFKKTLDWEADLYKADLSEDQIAQIAGQIQQLANKKSDLKQLEPSNPQAIQAIAELTDILKGLLSHHTKKPEPEEQPEQQEPVHMPRAVADKPIHQRQIIYGAGAKRIYDSKTARVKAPDGQWHSQSSGIAKRPWET